MTLQQKTWENIRNSFYSIVSSDESRIWSFNELLCVICEKNSKIMNIEHGRLRYLLRSQKKFRVFIYKGNSGTEYIFRARNIDGGIDAS